MLQFLSTDEKRRFIELQEKLSQLVINAAEQNELSALVAKAQNAAGARNAAIETIRRMIAEHGIAPQAVFSAAQIRQAGSATVERPKSKAASPKGKVGKSQRKSEDVLIQVKLDKSAGAPSRYKRSQKLGKFVSKNFKQLDTNGQLVENLLKYATPLGKSYFSTEAGRAELEAFAAFVRKTPMAA